MFFEDGAEMHKPQVSQLWLHGPGVAFLLLLVVILAGCGQQQAGIAAPSLTSISPNSGVQGQAVSVTLAGTGFAPACTIGLTGTGIAISNTTPVSGTQITATFTIGAGASPGARNVNVTCPGGTTSTVIFTVLGPTLTTISPNSGTQGQTVAVTLTGADFVAGCTIGVTGTGITISNTTVVSSTQITGTFTIGAGAPTGARNVTAVCPDGSSDPQIFTVLQLPPMVISTNPADGATVVPLNRVITATFNKPMDGATITALGTFTVTGPGVTPVAGTVSYDAATNTAIFDPSANLAADTIFTATITAAAEDTEGNALVSGPVPNPWTFTTGLVLDATAPTVIATTPADTATGVPTNTRITATFSEAMDPATINTATFTVTGPGLTPVAGTVTYTPATNTATFTPSANLAATTVFTATITAGATDLAGNALAGGGLAPNPWTFTTGSTADTAAPTVILTNPADGAMGVGVNASIHATFSEAMDPSTITTLTFTVEGPAATPVTGIVTYDPINFIATFDPSSDLDPSTTYTAEVTIGATDLAGNQLAPGIAPNPWIFTTGIGPVVLTAVDLGAASTFGGFGGAAGMTNQGIFTVINGDIGTTGASTLMTGFHDAGFGCIYTETPLNIGTVNGLIFTAPPPPTVDCPSEGTAETFAIATQAELDAFAAFDATSPAQMPCTAFCAQGGELGGLTLAPGIYESAPGTFAITLDDLTLDGQGDPNAVWVFQMGTSLTVGEAGTPRSVILINGAQAKNVFWHVGSAATINAAGGGTMVGTIIADAGVTFSTAGNVELTVLNGRALGLNASVTMVNTVINVPAP